MTNRKIEYWVIPPKADAEFVASMEIVLDTYEKAYDSTHPVLCMDEQPVQLIKETREPIPATRRHAKRIDYEYERAGTASIFMFTEPLAGWREATARPTKTKLDWAIEMARLMDGRYRRCHDGDGRMRQSQYPHHRRVLRGVPAAASSCAGEATSLLPHAEAWQLAEHRRERTQLFDKAMRLRQKIRSPAEVAIRTGCMVHGCQRKATWCRLANEGQRRPRKTQVPLPKNQVLTKH